MVQPLGHPLLSVVQLLGHQVLLCHPSNQPSHGSPVCHSVMSRSTSPRATHNAFHRAVLNIMTDFTVCVVSSWFFNEQSSSANCSTFCLWRLGACRSFLVNVIAYAFSEQNYYPDQCWLVINKWTRCKKTQEKLLPKSYIHTHTHIYIYIYIQSRNCIRKFYPWEVQHLTTNNSITVTSYERYGVSNHQILDCFFPTACSGRQPKIKYHGYWLWRGFTSADKWPVMRKTFPFSDVVMFISSNIDLCWLFLNPANHVKDVIIVAADLQLAQNGDNVKIYDGNEKTIGTRWFYSRNVMWCNSAQGLCISLSLHEIFLYILQ